MVLYTPMCQDDIFPTNNDQSNRKCITFEGKMVYVEDLNDGSYKMLQLMSSDPQDFLNTNYSPGTLFK